MASLRQRVGTFLDGPDRILALVGPSGTGRLYATHQAAVDRGLVCIVHDRAQGPSDYNRWGAPTLADRGLVPSVQLLCNADCETDSTFVARLPEGCKVVCLANSVSDAMKQVRIERVQPLTPGAMENILFLELG